VGRLISDRLSYRNICSGEATSFTLSTTSIFNLGGGSCHVDVKTNPSVLLPCIRFK